MAESIVSGLLEKLASSIIHELGLALNAKNDLRKLEITFQTIKCVLEDAESQSMKDKALFNWLAKLEDATYDMEDLLDYVEGRKLEIHGHMIKKVRPCIPASVEELDIKYSSRDEELLSDTSLQSSSRLRTLEIKGSGISSSANVQWTGLRHLASSLQELTITDWTEVRCLPESIRHLASLRILTLSACYKLSEIGEWVGELQSLRFLFIGYCPGLTSLPNGMRHLALNRLTIEGCPGLKEIPEWVEELQSLRSLYIRHCPGLTSLPNGMRHLALDTLTIDGCPGLKERCERERGEDWHIISHIPDITIW